MKRYDAWLLDTNVVASLIARDSAPSVKAWVAARDEDRLFLSILTFGEYDKGIANLAADDVARARYVAARDALAERFAGRILSVSDPVVRRWGTISGTVRRETCHPPPVIDTLFAATAIEHQLCLVTRNVRDVAATGAGIVNPWDSAE